MNRLAPTASDLYVSNADGTGEHKLIPTVGFDYHAQFSKDGQWVVFTSERDGLGESNIYRVKVDGTGLQKLTTHIAVDDAAVFSPVDDNTIAFVSSRSGTAGWGTANIWTLNIATGALKNLTGAIAFDATKPHGYFKPSFSPDGKTIAFSSDTGSAWRGHNLPDGWERTQETSIYAIKTDGTGFKKLASNAGYAEGSPSWSPDGTKVVFYETPVESTWGAHRPELIDSVSSELISVNVTTLARTALTSNAGFKVYPQYLNNTTVAYHVKGGSTEGLYTTAGYARATANSGIRSPNYSADGTKIVYEKVAFTPLRANGTQLFSFDSNWNYVYEDVFPQLSKDFLKIVYTEKGAGNAPLDGGIATTNPDFTGFKEIYNPSTSGLDPALIQQGLAGAFQPTWSPDRTWVAFGVGQWFFDRFGTGRVMRIKADGSSNGVPDILTDGTINSGFPSYSPDGTQLVYRVWSPTVKGLRILNLTTKATTILTTSPDNLPGWSPDGQRIVFTRKIISPTDPNSFNYDIFTIKPDGTNLQQLTTEGANDAHAVWTWDGRILFSSGANGFKTELSLYDNAFQPDGQNWVMNNDGTHPTSIEDTMWEDGMPLYVQNH